jgi:hypothetical protein
LENGLQCYKRKRGDAEVQCMYLRRYGLQYMPRRDFYADGMKEIESIAFGRRYWLRRVTCSEN